MPDMVTMPDRWSLGRTLADHSIILPSLSHHLTISLCAADDPQVWCHLQVSPRCCYTPYNLSLGVQSHVRIKRR